MYVFATEIAAFSFPFRSLAIAVRNDQAGDYEYIASVGESGGGLELMAGEGNGCDDVGTFGVEFGYDGVGCCILSLTRDELEDVSVKLAFQEVEKKTASSISAAPDSVNAISEGSFEND